MVIYWSCPHVDSPYGSGSKTDAKFTKKINVGAYDGRLPARNRGSLITRARRGKGTAPVKDSETPWLNAVQL